MTDMYYKYELCGFYSDPYSSLEEAQEAAEVEWESVVLSEGNPRDGEVFEDTAIMYTGVDGAEDILEEYVVTYEHYHGDRAEHFNQGDYL